MKIEEKRMHPNDVEKLIELGLEVEGLLSERDFRGVILNKNYQDTSNTRAKMRRILNKYSKETWCEEVSYNEELGYALQFVVVI